MPYLHGASHPSCADLWTRFLQHMYSGAQACARPTLYRSHISPVFFCRAGTYACLQAASCDRAAFLAAGCNDVLTHCRGGSFARVRLWLRLPVEFVHAGGCVVHAGMHRLPAVPPQGTPARCAAAKSSRRRRCGP